MPSAISRWVLPVPVVDQAQRVSCLDPHAGGQLPGDRRVDREVSVKRELLQPFWAGKASVADAPFDAAAGTILAFCDQQLREKPQVGQLFALGGGGDLGEPVADGGQAQHATALLDRGGDRLLGDGAPPGHEVSRPNRVSY